MNKLTAQNKINDRLIDDESTMTIFFTPNTADEACNKHQFSEGTLIIS